MLVVGLLLGTCSATVQSCELLSDQQLATLHGSHVTDSRCKSDNPPEGCQNTGCELLDTGTHCQGVPPPKYWRRFFHHYEHLVGDLGNNDVVDDEPCAWWEAYDNSDACWFGLDGVADCWDSPIAQCDVIP